MICWLTRDPTTPVVFLGGQWVEINETAATKSSAGRIAARNPLPSISQHIVNLVVQYQNVVADARFFVNPIRYCIASRRGSLFQENGNIIGILCCASCLSAKEPHHGQCKICGSHVERSVELAASNLPSSSTLPVRHKQAHAQTRTQNSRHTHKYVPKTHLEGVGCKSSCRSEPCVPVFNRVRVWEMALPGVTHEPPFRGLVSHVLGRECLTAPSCVLPFSFGRQSVTKQCMAAQQCRSPTKRVDGWITSSETKRFKLNKTSRRLWARCVIRRCRSTAY